MTPVMNTIAALNPGQVRPRLHDLTVIDVRTPAEYSSGHLTGALNIPLDLLDLALSEIREAADRGDLLMVCPRAAPPGLAAAHGGCRRWALVLRPLQYVWNGHPPVQAAAQSAPASRP
jgi:rhodanese-related sulfurtransferase